MMPVISAVARERRVVPGTASAACLELIVYRISCQDRTACAGRAHTQPSHGPRATGSLEEHALRLRPYRA